VSECKASREVSPPHPPSTPPPVFALELQLVQAHLFAFTSQPYDVSRVSKHGLDAHVIVHLFFQKCGLCKLFGFVSQHKGVEDGELGQHEQHKPAGDHVHGKWQCEVSMSGVCA